MKRKRKTKDRLFIERDIVRSRAWLSLGGIAPQVYTIFRAKCQNERPKGCCNWKIINNGQIYFPYSEAKKYGITAPRFCRAIDDLIEKGLIDVTETGMGVHKIQSLYAISERWRSYGEPMFVSAKRSKPPISNMGFRRGHTFTPKKKSSNENVTVSTNENVVPPEPQLTKT